MSRSFIFILLFSFIEALAGPVHMTYQGRLFDSSGDPVENGTVSIVTQVMDPLADCLLYEETHSVDMSQSSGFFSIQIGAGTQNTSTAPNFTLSESLSNAAAFNDVLLGCTGDSYTPGATDKRMLRVSIDGNRLDPDQPINSTPYSLFANEATNLGGKPLTQVESEYQSYADSNWAGTPLPDIQSTPLTAGDSFKWDGTKWIVFQPGSATGLTDVLGGTGLTDTGTTTKTLNIGAGDGITVNADDIAVNAGDGLQFNTGALEVNLGTGLQINAGAIEVNQSAISYSNISGTPAAATTSVDGLMSSGDKSKLDNIAANAEVNVNADWNASSGDAQIMNKPAIPSNITDLTVGNDSISGNAVNGGTISSFASTGIDDNAAATAMTIDGSGNVGIGTATPATTLDVQGTIRSKNNSYPIFRADGYGSPAAGHFIGSMARGTEASPTYPLLNDHLATFQGRDAIDWAHISSVTMLASEDFSASSKGTHISFQNTANGTTTPVERMRITHDGNVGVGTTSPIAKLHVNGGTDKNIKLHGGTASYGSTSGTAIFSTNDANDTFEDLSIAASNLILQAGPGTGNVGIGTASPDASALLDVSSITKGFLPPRMTTTERDAITTPAEGLVVYNTTTDKLNVVAGGAWAEVGSSGTGSGGVEFTLMDPYTNGTQATTPHGFGSAPKQLVWFLENKTAEKGYSPGDRVFHARDTDGSKGFALFSDSTNVGVSTSSTSAPGIIDKNGTSQSILTAANWKLGVIAYETLGGGVAASDTDNDTKIQVEESADEDIIRFDTAGTERMTINAAGAVNMTGDLTANSFNGDGSALTNIGATAIADNSITVDDLDFASSDGMNIPQLAADPGSPTAGQMYYNTTNNKMMVYNGSSWVEVGAGGGGGSVTTYSASDATEYNGTGSSPTDIAGLDLSFSVADGDLVGIKIECEVRHSSGLNAIVGATDSNGRLITGITGNFALSSVSTTYELKSSYSIGVAVSTGTVLLESTVSEVASGTGYARNCEIIAHVYGATLGGGSGGLADLVEDTSPQLGGDLDVNGNNITSTAGLDIAVGASAGNDFTVDTNKLVVEGDTGNVGVGTTSPTEKLDVAGCIKHNNGTLGTACSSDRRLKKDIEDNIYEDALNKISLLRPRKYRYRQGNQNIYLGVIAQELQEIAPELVMTKDDGYLAVDYEGLKWMSYEAIAELNKKLDQEVSILREESAAKDRKIESLEEEVSTLHDSLKALLERVEKLEAENP